MIDHSVGFGVHDNCMRYSQTAYKQEVCDNSICPMGGGLKKGGMTPAQIRAELDARNMTIRDLAEATGINENHLTKSLSMTAAKPRRIQLEEMELIEEALKPEDLEGRLGSIPILGKVPAGRPQEALQQGGRRLVNPDPATPPNAYALIVSGDSMNLIVDDGTILIIDPDDKALISKKRYVIKTERDQEATFKEYHEGPARLVPCSSNDEHKEILLGTEPIVVLGRVIGYHMKDDSLPRRVV